MRYMRKIIVLLTALFFIGSTITPVFGINKASLEDKHVVLDLSFSNPKIEKIEIGINSLRFLNNHFFQINN